MALEWDFSLPAPATTPEDEPNPLENFRAMPPVNGESMVYCIGCGDPMTLMEALDHGCELPPPGRL